MESDAVLRRRLLGSSLLRAGRLALRRPLDARRTIARARLLDASAASVEEDRLVDWIVEEAADRRVFCSRKAAQRLLAIADKARRPYTPPKRSDVDVIIAYFNPAKYKRSATHIHKTCCELLAVGVTPIVAEVVHDQAVALPEGVHRLQFFSKSVLFHKENLQNLAASVSTKPKMLFIDCDLEFSRRDFLDAVSQSLDEYDVVQPFVEANWLDRNGAIGETKIAMAEAMRSGSEPNINKFHPGFAWAMTRAAFDALGGFYDLHVIGGGDSAFAYAVARSPMEKHIPTSACVAATASHQEYAKRAAAIGLRVGATPGRVFHLWHGTRQNRRYSSRYSYLPATVDGEYPVIRRPDGLLEWVDDAHSRQLLQYLLDRQEDG